MKVKVNLYFDGADNSVDWRVSTRRGGVIHTAAANFSGEIESTRSFKNREAAITDVKKFCKLVGIHQIDFFNKSNLDKPEISE